MYIPANNPRGGGADISWFSAMEELVNGRLPLNKDVS